MEILSIAEASPMMFPGFRFSPTDEELIEYYLKKKVEGSDDAVKVIPEVDICRHEPWDLPAQSVIQSDSEWFFFSSRGRKYPNGCQSKRATASGYWKATGKERGVKSGSTLIGNKRTLVFHKGRAPKGQRTEWIMHEYTTTHKSEDAMVVCRLRKNMEFHLNDDPRPGFFLDNVDNSTLCLSGVDQSGMLDGANSSTAGSSHNSDSLEQVTTGSDSDEKLANESSSLALPQSRLNELSINGQGNAVEDDCYADIMKDDIIELDDASVYKEKIPKPQPSLEDEDTTNIAHLPFQGTATRRLRLRGQTTESHFHIENALHSSPQPRQERRHLIHKFPTTTTRNTSSAVPFVVAMFISLLLFLLTRD